MLHDGQDECTLGNVKSKEFTIEGEPIWVAPPEYVILRKLEYFREGKSEKHLRILPVYLQSPSTE